MDEGLFGEIPDHLAHYIDYDAITRDLAIDHTETEIGGERLIYRCPVVPEVSAFPEKAPASSEKPALPETPVLKARASFPRR